MNNSRIFTIKNAKFSGYYFYMNFNIWEDFQICISIPLMFLKLFWKFWKNSRNSFVMEFLFRKLRAYKLHTSAVWTEVWIQNKIEAGKFKNKKIKITRWYIFLLKGYLKRWSEHREIHLCGVIGCPFWVYNFKLLKSSIKIS